MRPVEIPEGEVGALRSHYRAASVRVVLGEGQPQYEPLPAVALEDEDRSIPMVTDWRPSAAELEALNRGFAVRLTQLTFGRPFQPVTLTVPAAEASEQAGAEQERQAGAEAERAEMEAAAQYYEDQARAEAEALSHGVWAGEA